MKICPNCGARFGDENRFCTICGTPIPEEATPIPAAPNAFSAYYQPAATVPVSDPFDHSEEFDEADIHANKLYAMAVYLLSIIGIVLALLGARESAYVQFHVKQGLKFCIVELLLGLCAGVLFFTIIVPIAAGVCLAILEVIRIIAFFQVCGNKAKEPAIIRGLSFLN